MGATPSAGHLRHLTVPSFTKHHSKMSGLSRCGPWTSRMSRHPAPPASRAAASRGPMPATAPPLQKGPLRLFRKAVSPPSKPRKVVRNWFGADGCSPTNPMLLGRPAWPAGARRTIPRWTRAARRPRARTPRRAPRTTRRRGSPRRTGPSGRPRFDDVSAALWRVKTFRSRRSAAFQACFTFRSCVLRVVLKEVVLLVASIWPQDLSFSTQRKTFVGANAFMAVEATIMAGSLMVTRRSRSDATKKR